MRRIDEKDEIDCEDKSQHTEVLLERATLEVKCRLKVGSKLSGGGWTEVFGVKSDDLAHFECKSSFKGLHMD